MSESTWKLAPLPRMLSWLLLATILLAAFVLRTHDLDRVPPGPYYDEASAMVLASEVASGQSLPIFIVAYTGHEVLYYYIAAIVMRLGGVSIWTLRLTSALMGTVTVLMTYLLTEELFRDDPLIESRWLGLFSAALMAVSFWHISISRYGFRGIIQPLAQSFMLFALWRGLRRSSRTWIVFAGVWCGLVAYTYTASRIVPVALALVLLLALIAERKRWRKRLSQLSLFVLVALIVFAPLGIFFLQHPGIFSVRTSQITIFSEGNDWRSIGLRNTLRALEVFTSRGDPTRRFNLPNQPMFQGPLAVAFYLGVAMVVWSCVRPSGFMGRVRYALIILWILILLLPTILSDPVEVPHSVRAIGILPFPFIITAIGVMAALIVLQRLLRHRRGATGLSAIALIVTCAIGGVVTFHNYFARWAVMPALYYDNNQDIADMAHYVDAQPDDGRTVYVSSPDFRHPTVAALAHNFGRLKWMMGGDVCVFSPGPATYVWPHASLPDDSWLVRFFPPSSRVAEQLGPDGALAYMAYRLDAPPIISPTVPLSVSVGALQAIGYDVLRDRPSGGRTDVAVYWRVIGRPERGDYSEFMTLRDAWGIQRGEGGSFAYSSEQWTPGEIIAERVRVQIDDGTPPGQYTIKLGWWSPATGQRLPAADAQGRFAGTLLSLGPITITQRVRPLDLATVNITHRMQKEWDGLTWLGFDQWPAVVRQGESVFATLYWQAGALPRPDHIVTLQLRAADDRVTVLARGAPGHGTWPTSQWQPGEFIADRAALRVPPDTPAGTYTLELRVDDGPVQPLDRVEVRAIQRAWSPPAIEHPVSLTLGAQIALAGFTLDPPVARAGQPITLTLAWHSLQAVDADYAVFVHLVDANGAVRSQQDRAPVNGLYATSLWLPGEFVADAHTLDLPSDLPEGEYTLRVGMYLPDNGARLWAPGGHDGITLGPIWIASH